jgi:diaminopimelate decarboxylase
MTEPAATHEPALGVPDHLSTSLWPDTAVRADGVLVIGGAPVTDLVAQYGTPLYVFDAATLDAQADRITHALTGAALPAEAVYASKALALPQILRRFAAKGFGIDVVSEGELLLALRAGIDPAAITFHGNNKSADELRLAIERGVGLIAVDNLLELDLLHALVRDRARKQAIMIRVNPGIDVHTHDKIATGVIDSKFGFPLWDGSARAAVEHASAIAGLDIAGYHAHLGSQLFDIAAPAIAAGRLVAFAAEIRDEFGIMPRWISPGGGLGIAYEPGNQPVDVDTWIASTLDAVDRSCSDHSMPVPTTIFEPGRALVGRAGIALYRVGARKAIRGVRTYVSVDGGMADNIRPALYDARYTATLANRTADGPAEEVTIAGKYCESGDLLIEDIALPELAPGDILALPVAGAYSIPLASNYNMAPRPALVLVEQGRTSLLRRRETYADMVSTIVGEFDDTHSASGTRTP